MKFQGVLTTCALSGMAFGLLGLTSATPAMAMAKSILRCTSNNSSCTIKGMPVLSQLSEAGTSMPSEPDDHSFIPNYWFSSSTNAYSSVLCVPTSGSMVLKAVIANTSKPHSAFPGPAFGSTYPNSTAKFPANLSLASWDSLNEGLEIGAMSNRMATSTTNGSYYNGYTDGTTGLAPYFFGGTGDSRGGNPLLTVANVKSLMDGNAAANLNGSVMGIAFGWYSAKVLDFGVQKTLYFSRGGGHANAFSGYAGSTLILNDPWGGFQLSTTLPQIGTHLEGHTAQTCTTIFGHKFCVPYAFVETVLVPGVIGTDAMRDVNRLPDVTNSTAVANAGSFTFIDEYHTLGAQ